MSSARLTAKAEEIPPVFFRIKPEVHARLELVLKRHSGGRNDLARDGLLREIERLEQQAAPVTPKEAKAIETFKKVTGCADISSVLAAASRDHVRREAAATAA